MQKFEIVGIHLGSNQLINNLAKHFKNLTNLILTNNDIASIDPDMIPENVKVMEISKNNLKCDCNTLDDLRILKKRLDFINIHEMQCPENNMTFANAYEKLNCLQLIESTKNNERITLILIFLTVTLVIIVAMILYLIRRRRVRTMKQKQKHVSQPLLPRDQNCVFDIFISYAEADWQIMEEIFRKLSNGSLNQSSFTLAFNEKDCIPGKMGKNELY